MRLKLVFETVKKQMNTLRTVFDPLCKLNWLFVVICGFLAKQAIKFHTNPYILPLGGGLLVSPGSPVI